MAITTAQFKTLQDRISNLETTVITLASLALQNLKKEAGPKEMVQGINTIMKQCVHNGIALNSPVMMQIKEQAEKEKENERAN